MESQFVINHTEDHKFIVTFESDDGSQVLFIGRYDELTEASQAVENIKRVIRMRGGK